MTSAGLPPDLRSRLLERVAKTPSPTQPQVQRRRVLWIALAATPLLAFAGMMGVDHVSRPAVTVGATFMTALVVATGTTRWALGRGRNMLGKGQVELGLATAIAPTALLVAFALSTRGLPAHVQVDDARCAMMTIFLAAIPLLVLLTLERRSELREPSLRGLALGAAAGAWPAVPMALTCGGTALGHYALAHVAPIFLVALAGAALGARWLGVRSAK